jgi:zinc-binding in reverse transcriptase
LKVSAWLMLLKRILTTDNLKKRGWALLNICVMCRADEESVHHLLNSCDYIRSLSHALLPDFTNDLPPDLLAAITDITVQKKIREIILIAQFIIWREHCSRIFKNQMKQYLLILEEIRLQWRWLNSSDVPGQHPHWMIDNCWFHLYFVFSFIYFI